MSIGITNDIKIMIKMMLATIIVTAVREVNVVTDKAFGSMLEEGSVTMLSYGSKITVVFVSLVSTAISVVGFTDIAPLILSAKSVETGVHLMRNWKVFIIL